MKARGVTRETILDHGVQAEKHPSFKVGDTIEVDVVVKEGDKERIQPFQGDVIAMHNNGIATTFTIRRLGANGVGIERIFPLYAPIISQIRLVKTGKVRRAKLFYIRERQGKAARIKERMQHQEAPAAVVAPEQKTTAASEAK